MNQITLIQMTTALSLLKLQAKTGMKFRKANAYAIVKQWFGYTAKQRPDINLLISALEVSLQKLKSQGAVHHDIVTLENN